MNYLLQYSLEVTLCWALFYTIFISFLRKETFFNINRWYLLIAILLGTFIPMLRYIDLDFGQNDIAEAMPLVYVIKEAPGQIVIAAEKHYQWWIGILLFSIYMTGVLFFTCRFIKSLFKIKDLYSSGTKTREDGHTLVETHADHLPFSFLQYVFISSADDLGDAYDRIIRHELAHVKSRHTVDVLFVELISIAFWWNPLVYLYKTALRQTHEYLADASVLKNTSKKIYGTMLLKQSMSGLEIALAHHFFHSHIKKRINMMYQKQSGPSAWLKYALALPVLFFLTVVFAKAKSPLAETISDEMIEVLSEVIDTGEVREIFKEVDVMPRFPGCEDITGDDDDKKACSDKLLFENLYSNLKYPEEAKRKQIEGRVFIQFVIEPDGTVSESRIVRDIGGGCGQAALNIVNAWNDLPQRWTPGKLRGKAVPVMYTLPITFKLDDNNNDSASAHSISAVSTVESKNSRQAAITSSTLLIVDGKEVNKSVLEAIPPDNIVMMNVWSGEQAKTFNLAEGQNTVIEITTKSNKNLATQPQKSSALNDTDQPPYIVIDGKESTRDIMNQLNPDDIVTVQVYKDDKASKKYPGKGQNGVIEITTKSNKNLATQPQKSSALNDTDQPPYIVIDGKESTRDKMNQLNPDDIATVNVYKDDQAFKKYPGKGQNGVIEITTKTKGTPKDTLVIFDVKDYTESFYVIEKEAESMPMFNKFDADLTSEELKRADAQNNLFRYIGTNLKYPASAKEEGIEGTVMVKFVIDTKGKIISSSIVRGLDSRCDAEVIRVLNKMNSDMNQPFLPGYKDGKAVNVEMVLPIKFALSGDMPSSSNALSIDILRRDGMLSYIYNSPEGGPSSVVLTDIAGKTIKNYKETFNKGSNRKSSSLGINLSPGIYVLTIEEKGKVISQKVSVQ